MGKQTEKHVGVLKSLDFFFLKKKEIVEMQNVIKKDNLNCKRKPEKTYYLGKYLLPIVF